MGFLKEEKRKDSVNRRNNGNKTRRQECLYPFRELGRVAGIGSSSQEIPPIIHSFFSCRNVIFFFPQGEGNPRMAMLFGGVKNIEKKDLCSS